MISYLVLHAVPTIRAETKPGTCQRKRIELYASETSLFATQTCSTWSDMSNNEIQAVRLPAHGQVDYDSHEKLGFEDDEKISPVVVDAPAVKE